jgi:glutathione S-transferase
MLFYDSVGPNPQIVRIFAAERGVSLPSTKVDLRGGENRQAAYLAKNPSGQLPCLELDNGLVLAEITAICEYLDEIGPAGKTLIGSTPEERAETRMWVRRIDLNILEPLANGFRFAEGLKLFQSRIRTIPQAADDLKLLAKEKLAWLTGLLEGRQWVCGDRLTLADLLLYVFLEFGAAVGQKVDPANSNVLRIIDQVKARDSAKA